MVVQGVLAASELEGLELAVWEAVQAQVLVESVVDWEDMVVV